LETDIANRPAFLNTKIFSAFERGHDAKLLPELCLELLSEQKKAWHDLEQGYESLKEIKVREITCNGFSVRVQHNPGRIRSTLADVGEANVNERPCFLCLNNLPKDQKGILYHKEFLILCNPMPVFSGHFTIVHLVHQPQAITEYIDSHRLTPMASAGSRRPWESGELLQAEGVAGAPTAVGRGLMPVEGATRAPVIDIFFHLMSDFGSNWSVLYNGPRCGASAPNHLHFQVIPSGNMPIEIEIANVNKHKTVHINDVRVSRAQDLGRELIIIEGDDPKGIADTFKRIVTELKKVFDIDNEPMMNIIGSHDGGKLRLMVFPRAKHRPDAFFREGDARVVVSPAIIEMGGVLVTPVERDFERLDASAIEGIFEEVSLKGEIVQGIIDDAAEPRHNSNSRSR
jgi:hypothetical protein